MMVELKEGDVVQLRSGGCLMTFAKFTDGALWPIHCTWFDGDGQLQSADFRRENLQKVTIEE